MVICESWDMMGKEGYKEVKIGPRNYIIPKNWRKTEISDVCENLDRKREPVKASNRESGNIPYYGATGCIDHVNDYIFDEKLVLVGEDGADWSEFAQTAYIVEGKSWVNNHAHVLRCISIKDKYLCELLNFLELNYIIVGTNRGKLNKKALMNLEVLFPPLPEQKKIATILSTVDEAIEKTDKLIEETKQLKKGLMQQLLTKGIGHSEFKEVNLGPMKLENPKSWSVQRIDKLSKELIGGGTPSTEKERYWGGNIPWITGAFIEDRLIKEGKKYISEEGLKNSSTHVIPKDNILLCTRTAVGNVGVNYVNMAISQDITGIIIDEKAISSEYLVWQILKLNHLLKSFEQGSTIKGITQKVVKNFEIPLPPLKEQKKIASILTSVDKKIQKEKAYKEQLQQLKKGLMQKLLTGEIRVQVEDEEE